MKKRYAISDINDLYSISFKINDHFFKLKDILYDSESCTLTVPFWHDDSRLTDISGPIDMLKNSFRALKKMIVKKENEEVEIERPVKMNTLAIGNVSKYEIVDTEKIGTYMLNDIVYDKDDHLFKIWTGEPLTFLIHVSGIDVSVEMNETEDERFGQA